MNTTRAALRKLCIAALLFCTAIACAQNSRIIRETPTSIIVAGEGDSRIEAEFAAIEAVQQRFPEYNETRELECSQEYRGTASNAMHPGAGHLVSESRGYTFWQCVIFAEAK